MKPMYNIKLNKEEFDKIKKWEEVRVFTDECAANIQLSNP